MKEKFKESFLIGFFSFLIPFVGIFLFTYHVTGWSLKASLIAGTALSTTSLAVVYSVLVETNLSKTEIGKIIMASTFITDMGVALAMSLLFVKPSLYTVIFILASILVIFLAAQFSHLVFANLGEGHAVLLAFLLGLLMSKHFQEGTETKIVQNRLRTVAYAIITPIFFIVGGLKVSFPLILSALGLFVILFFIKLVMKFIGVYFLARKYIPNGSMYTTLLMSTGLTFGTIVSAVIPTVIAQKWFMPVHSEDLVELND